MDGVEGGTGGAGGGGGEVGKVGKWSGESGVENVGWSGVQKGRERKQEKQCRAKRPLPLQQTTVRLCRSHLLPPTTQCHSFHVSILFPLLVWWSPVSASDSPCPARPPCVLRSFLSSLLKVCCAKPFPETHQDSHFFLARSREHATSFSRARENTHLLSRALVRTRISQKLCSFARSAHAQFVHASPKN